MIFAFYIILIFKFQIFPFVQEEEETEDPLAMEEDDSVLEGSVTESSSFMEAPEAGDSSTPLKIVQVR